MSAQVTPDLTSDDKLWALLAYLPFIGWIFAIIDLLMEDKKKRPFIKFHAVQALILAIVIYVISGVLAAIIIGACVWIVGIIYMIYLGVKAYQGVTVPVPFLTDFIKKQGWG